MTPSARDREMALAIPVYAIKTKADIAPMRERIAAALAQARAEEREAIARMVSMWTDLTNAGALSRLAAEIRARSAEDK